MEQRQNLRPPVFTKLLKHLHLADFDIPLEDIHEVNVEAMIKSHYFAFSVDMYSELSESYPALSETYILENKDAFLAEVSTVPLEKDVFEKLVISKQTDNAFKESIIKNHGVTLLKNVRHLCMCQTIAGHSAGTIGRICLDIVVKTVIIPTILLISYFSCQNWE